jgi:molybdate transport system regulatory protein
MSRDSAVTVRLKIAFDGEARLGPGKMDLLEAIARTGSISAGGRALGMSYRRAWLLVDALNATFEEACVKAAAGGAHGGGAALTPFGEHLLAAYREIESETCAKAAVAFSGLKRRRERSRAR